jgi:hypothetical protein
MNANRILSSASTTLISLSVALALAGCNNKPAAPDDATLNTQVQARLFADQNLSGQSIQTSVSNGIATLDGSVTSDTARTIASGDVAHVAGIKTVVNNLVVQSQPASNSAQLFPPQPLRTNPKRKKPSAMAAQASNQPPAPVERDNTPQPQPTPPPAPVVGQVQAPAPPPPPPAPVVHNITLPAGTDIPVRITQTLDSATTQTGDKFTGAIASDIIVDGMVVLAQGTPVAGHVDAAQDAAHFKGSALLTVSLTAIDRRGEHIAIATDGYTKQGEGRGKNTAEKVGGGAAVGAILGGIFGGGKGAAIGSVAGGGLGAGAQGVTRGQQVQIPSETVVRFRLSDPVIVHITTGGSSAGNNSPILERHNNQ